MPLAFLTGRPGDGRDTRKAFKMDRGQEPVLWNTGISASLWCNTRRSEKLETTFWQHTGPVASYRVTRVISLGTGV